MLGVIARIALPEKSWRGRKARQVIKGVRNRRALNFAKNRYNLSRQSYYKHATRKRLDKTDECVSIIVPCYNTPKKYFEPLLASVFAQGYENWELVLIDGSTESYYSDYIKLRSEADTRIVYKKVKNKGIALNTNEGFKIAKGKYIALLDHDDTLDPDALAESIESFQKNPDMDLVYSDEDKISDDGEKYFEPHFKPHFSLDLLRNVNYITHFVVVKKEIVDRLGGIREGFDGAQDYDFLLRVIDEPNISIGHVSKILYHWRQAEGSTAADFSNKKSVTDAGVRALKDHFKRRSIEDVEPYAIDNRPGFYAAKYKIQQDKHRIVLQLKETNLLAAEKEFIVGAYRKNKDVKKYNIEIVVDESPNETDLVVNGAFIPARADASIAPLFALSRESGVEAVSPAIVRNGRIYDMGIVINEGVKKSLFKGLNPERQICFGSPEWVRNVDEISMNVRIGGQSRRGRNIVWTHSEFVAFLSASDHVETSVFYNPNIVELTELIEGSNDHISDIVEVDR